MIYLHLNQAAIGTRAYFSWASWGDDDGAVGEELEGAEGGGFIDDADLGDDGAVAAGALVNCEG